MLLSLNIAGMSFSGGTSLALIVTWSLNYAADVGGFFGNPSHELLVRWYQAGTFSPFFRAHAHIDTKRREPYLFEEPIRGYLRDAIRLRYQLLPVWYNAFHDASVNGVPIMRWVYQSDCEVKRLMQIGSRPQYAMFPEDEGGFAIDDQFYLGDSGLLVKPVTREGAVTTDVYISDNQVGEHQNTFWKG